MSAPIGTSREIKNKETGLDISVPDYREVSGLLTSYEEYHIIVITNLPYFKTIRNKQDNNVQFMVEKKYADFEALHKALTERYPATIFPDLPRKVLMVKDSTPQERRQSFDNLMKFIASSTKVCCSSLVLTFLGVKPDRIQLVEEGADDVDQKDEESVEPPKLTTRRSKLLSSGSQQSSLFSDDPEDEFDFFQASSNGVDTNKEDLEDDLFSENSQQTSGIALKTGKYHSEIASGCKRGRICVC